MQMIDGKLSKQTFSVCSHPSRKSGDSRLTQELYDGLKRILDTEQIWQEEVETLHCSLLRNVDRAVVFKQHPDQPLRFKATQPLKNLGEVTLCISGCYLSRLDICSELE
jgi:hypothetical protein